MKNKIILLALFANLLNLNTANATHWPTCECSYNGRDPVIICQRGVSPRDRQKISC